jgi:hypothetical protein
MSFAIQLLGDCRELALEWTWDNEGQPCVDSAVWHIAFRRAELPLSKGVANATIETMCHRLIAIRWRVVAASLANCEIEVIHMPLSARILDFRGCLALQFLAYSADLSEKLDVAFLPRLYPVPLTSEPWDHLKWCDFTHIGGCGSCTPLVYMWQGVARYVRKRKWAGVSVYVMKSTGVDGRTRKDLGRMVDATGPIGSGLRGVQIGPWRFIAHQRGVIVVGFRLELVPRFPRRKWHQSKAFGESALLWEKVDVATRPLAPP